MHDATDDDWGYFTIKKLKYFVGKITLILKLFINFHIQFYHAPVITIVNGCCFIFGPILLTLVLYTLTNLLNKR